jgi:TolB-like protein
MIFQFEHFTLDDARGELVVNDEPRPIQPQVFLLLEMLIKQADRMVSKDEIIENVWGGRFISDAALNSCVRLARQAVDDDGKQQRVIKTVHGRGFRFVASISVEGDEPSNEEPSLITKIETANTEAEKPVEVQRPTIAILPFTLVGSDQNHQAIAEAIPAELITTLSRLRWLRVIARGSSFKFGGADVDADNLVAKLGADYAISGRVELAASAISITVELGDTRSREVVWSDRYSGNLDDIYALREKVAREVTNILDLRISLHEADRLSLTPTEDLNAWGHYHQGVRHMYRYSQANNLIAENHFSAAIALDPNFARAQAARSYTEFQNHFQLFGNDRSRHKTRALEAAELAVDLDPLDPFCTLMMGRAKWLFGDIDEGLGWVERSLGLNPNYSYGFYNDALLRTVACEGHLAATQVETAIALSPLDPHLQSMLGTRAMAAYVSDDLQAAAQFAGQAMRAPNPHLYVYMIAAVIFSQAGASEQANGALEKIRQKNTSFGKKEFLQHYDLRDLKRKTTLMTMLDKLGL